jgi:hypothetical protein
METNPEEQRGGTTPDEQELQEKGEWAEGARDGIVPRDEEADQSDDAALGRTTGSDEPATREGVDLSAGDNADATSDGGVELPEEGEPDLKDAMGAHHRPEAGN